MMCVPGSSVQSHRHNYTQTTLEESHFTESMPPTQAAPLIPCSQGPGTKVWHSGYFQNSGGQLFRWRLGCLHVELQLVRVCHWALLYCNEQAWCPSIL